MADNDTKQYFTQTTYAARKLANTPNTTTSFLRGDNTFTNTLTGQIIIEQPNNSSQDVYVKRGNIGIWFGIGNNNTTSGLYSTNLGDWIISVDTSRQGKPVVVHGNASTADTLYNTPGNKLSFLRSDNTWTTTIEGTYCTSNQDILKFDYLGYDPITHNYTGQTYHSGTLSIDESNLMLILPNAKGTIESMLTFQIKRRFANKIEYAPMESLLLKTFATSEFSGTYDTSNTPNYNLIHSALVLREVERKETINLTDAYAPRLGFNWKGQTTGSLYMDATGIFYLTVNNGTGMADLIANSEYAKKALSDEDGINNLKYQYVRVYNSAKIKITENANQELNASVTVNDLARYGNAFATIKSATNNPTGGANTINCISITEHSDRGTRNTSQLAIFPGTAATTMYIRGQGNINGSINDIVNWRQIPTFTANIIDQETRELEIGRWSLPVYFDANGLTHTITYYEGTAAKADQLAMSVKIWGQPFDGSTDVDGNITFGQSNADQRMILWQLGGSDYARLMGSSVGNDGGYFEIATADNGNEPIYVRQYQASGNTAYSTIKNEIKLLDASGNTYFPKTVTIVGGNLVVTTGGIGVTAGNITLDIGDITATLGNISAGGSISSGGNLSVGAVLSVTGNTTIGGTLSVTGNVTAPLFIGNLQGNADTATALTTSAGSLTKPIYFKNGKPAEVTYGLSANVSSGIQFGIAYYSTSDTINCHSEITTDNFGHLYVNGDIRSKRTGDNSALIVAEATGGKIYLRAKNGNTSTKGLYAKAATTNAAEQCILDITQQGVVGFYGNATSATNATNATYATYMTSTSIGSETVPVFFNESGQPQVCTSIGLAATSAEKLTSYGGSSTQPVYFPSSGTNAGKPVAIDYSINANISAGTDDTTYTQQDGIDVCPIAYYTGKTNIGFSGTVVLRADGGHLYVRGDMLSYRRSTDNSYWSITGSKHNSGRISIDAGPLTTSIKRLRVINAVGTGKNIIEVDQNNAATFDGTASSANKLNTDAGSNIRPIYFYNGIPTVCSKTSAMDIQVDWTHIQNAPTFTTTENNNSVEYKIDWSAIDNKPPRAVAALDGYSAKYVALELNSSRYELNFETGTSARPVRDIYFNARWRRTQNGAAKVDTRSSSNHFDDETITDPVNYYFCSYRGFNASNSSYYSNAYLYAGRVYHAYWNDYAEFRTTVRNAKPGQVVIDHDDGTMEITTKRLLPGAQIVSDTYGTAMGESEKDKTPVAVAGRVLACPYRDKKEYHAGMAVCSAPNGTVDIMSKIEIVLHPDCIIGYVSEIPDYETWGQVTVNGRIWIKLR